MWQICSTVYHVEEISDVGRREDLESLDTTAVCDTTASLKKWATHDHGAL